jgi:hypothetical protein
MIQATAKLSLSLSLSLSHSHSLTHLCARASFAQPQSKCLLLVIFKIIEDAAERYQKLVILC